VKLKPQEIEIENIDHLGIVAGIIDSIGIVEIINPTFRTPQCHNR
jgi:acyl carrier protein